MSTRLFWRTVMGIASAWAATTLFAEPVTYQVDSRHTFPSFEADHQGGVSVWRGKIESTSGTIVIDREARTGTVNITMDMDTIDFGLDDMTAHAKAEDILHVERFPTATYTGTLTSFNRAGNPTAVEGELTLHGVTRPVNLQITRFGCYHNREETEICGGDASASFNRDDFGVDFAKQLGFLMYVNLEIQVEGIRVET